MTRKTETEHLPSVDAREWVRGNKPTDPTAYPHAGEVDDGKVRRLMSLMAEHYDPDPEADMPARIDDTRLYRILRRVAATDTATKAVRSGHDYTLSYLVGNPGRKSDISGIKAIKRIEDMLLSPAPIIYIWGEPGSGKTNIALLLAQLWHQHYDGEMASNIRTWVEQDEWIASYPQLNDWLSDQTRDISGGGSTRREDAEHRLMIFDEASSHAAGRGQQGYETATKLAPLVKKIRKARAGLIIIGHDGKDVAPSIRTLATTIERRRGQVKRAWIWESVTDRQGEGLIAELTGVPETDYRYDDGEATSWRWSDKGGDDDEPQLTEDDARELAVDMTKEQIKRFGALLAMDDNVEMTQQQIGKIVGQAYKGEPFSRRTIYKWKQEVDDTEPLDPDHN